MPTPDQLCDEPCPACGAANPTPDPYVIRLSAEDFEWYESSVCRKRDLQAATQRAASDRWREAQLVTPDGTVLFTAQPRNE